MAIQTQFENGVFSVIRDGRVALYQPFKPTSTGAQEAWTDEQAALDWFSNHYLETITEEEANTITFTAGA
jgi:hypothetical protein